MECPPSPPYKHPVTPPVPFVDPYSLLDRRGSDPDPDPDYLCVSDLSVPASALPVPSPDYSSNDSGDELAGSLEILGDISSACSRDSLHVDETFEHFKPINSRSDDKKCHLTTANVKTATAAPTRDHRPDDHSKRELMNRKAQDFSEYSAIFFSASTADVAIGGCMPSAVHHPVEAPIGATQSKFYHNSVNSLEMESPPPLPMKNRSRSADTDPPAVFPSLSKFYRHIDDDSLSYAVAAHVRAGGYAITSLQDVFEVSSDPRVSAYRLTASAPDLTEEDDTMTSLTPDVVSHRRGSDMTSSRLRRAPLRFMRPSSSPPPQSPKLAKSPLLRRFQEFLTPSKSSSSLHPVLDISAPIRENHTCEYFLTFFIFHPNSLCIVYLFHTCLPCNCDVW